MSLTIELLTTPGCPNAPEARRTLREVAGRLAPEAETRETVVETRTEAERLRFPGSPTIRVDGEDLEGVEAGPPALACRRYPGAAGAPPEWLVEAGILRALRPRHILFLCVHNSARSQVAEGIARELAPAGVTVSSAGSTPAPAVNPLAIRALAEIGIDISRHRPKGVDEVSGPPVDAVITLCAEEACPAFLGRAWRLHWGLPDPAAAPGTEEERLEAFRRVRDELRRRLAGLFASA